MSSLNVYLIIFITILVLHQTHSQYGDLEKEIVDIRASMKKLKEFVDRYTKGANQFVQAQQEAGYYDEFRKFEQSVLGHYGAAIRALKRCIKELEALRDATKDIQGDIVKIHFSSVEALQTFDEEFRPLWKKYSDFLNSLSEEEAKNEQANEQGAKASEQGQPPIKQEL